MNSYCTKVWTLPQRCSRSWRTVWKSENCGSATPAFFYAQMAIIVFISDIVVPVRPMPAEQWTIDFSLFCDLRFHSTKWFSMISKSNTALPSGTPWSGQPTNYICVTFCTEPSGRVACISLFKTSLFFERSCTSTSSTYVVSGSVYDYVILHWKASPTLSGQN